MTELPADWRVSSLREAFKETLGGGTPSTRHSEYWGGKIPWTTSAKIDGLYLREGQKQITETGLANSASHSVPAGNLLIATRVGVGKSAVNLIDVAISQDLTGCIVDKNRFDPLFLALLLRTSRCQQFFALRKRGATIQGIPREDLLGLEIIEPPLREQHAIAAALSKIQAAAETQSKILATLRELKAATKAKLFREGLSGEPLKSSELGKIPRSWDVVKLGQVCRISSGGTPARDNPIFWNGKIPWVKTGEINYRRIKRTEEHIAEAGLAGSAAKIFPRGTVLMAMYGQGVTRGRVAILEIDAATNQACAALTPERGLDSEFLYAYCEFAYNRIRNLGHGANQQNLSIDILKGLLIPQPKKQAEQRRMAQIFRKLDEAITNQERRQEQLATLFNSALHSLMTGEARIPGETHARRDGIPK